MGSLHAKQHPRTTLFPNLEKTTVDWLHCLLFAWGKNDDTVMFTKWKSDRKQKDLTILPRGITQWTALPNSGDTLPNSLVPLRKAGPLLMWWPGHQAYVEFYYKVKNSECLHTTCLIRIITLFSSVLQIENQLLEMSERISSERCQQRLTKNTQWMLAICPSNIHQGTALLLKWESSAYSSSGPSQCVRYWWHIRREEVGSVS